MNDSERLAFYDRLLRATGFDHTDDLWWRESDDRSTLDFYINCNDIFAWGCADLERVTPDNVHILEGAIRDCAAIDDHVWGPLLFCARVRKMRPQGCCYPKDNTLITALFDAAGPKRDVDFANPYAHPEDGGKYEYSSSCGVPLVVDAADPVAANSLSTSTREKPLQGSFNSDYGKALEQDIIPH